MADAFEPAILKEGVGDHCHERMPMQALPGSALKVIETEFFFQLLMSLLANPSRLDGCRQGAQVGHEIIFFLSRRTVFADKASFLPREML